MVSKLTNMSKGFQFSQAELDSIKEAVQKAETTTSGEIVPFFAAASDDYEESCWRAASFSALLALLIVASLSFSWNLPFVVTPWEVALFTVVMGVVGFLACRFSDAIKRWITPHSVMVERVIDKSLIAFLNEEVFKTENRTGILIYISHFEHMVDVIGDSGINSKVDKKEWEQVVKLIVEGIKAGNPADGIVRGVDKCGQLLVAAGVHKPKDNPNELSDDIRLG